MFVQIERCLSKKMIQRKITTTGQRRKMSWTKRREENQEEASSAEIILILILIIMRFTTFFGLSDSLSLFCGIKNEMTSCVSSLLSLFLTLFFAWGCNCFGSKLHKMLKNEFYCETKYQRKEEEQRKESQGKNPSESFDVARMEWKRTTTARKEGTFC